MEMLMNQKKDLRAGRRMLEMDFVTRSGRNVTTDRPPLGSPLVPPGEAVTPCHQTIYVDPGLMWSDSRPIVF